MNAPLVQPVLVLDAGYQAVNIVPMRRALTLLAKGKAVAVEVHDDEVYRSERALFRRPVIIRLLIAIAHRVYRTLRIRFNKQNILARDGYACQYCGATDASLTIDHVVPRSRCTPRHPGGGPHSWENCVTACLPCNNRKGNRTPEEAAMPLRTRPGRPRWVLALPWGRGDGGLCPEWRQYLP